MNSNKSENKKQNHAHTHTSSEALQVFSMGFVIFFFWTGSFFGLLDVCTATFLWLKILLA